MPSYGLGEMFEGEFADTCSEKFHLRLPMGGQATLSGVSGNFVMAEVLIKK